MLFTRFQKLDSHLGYLFEEPCLSVLPSPWHQRLGFIAKLSGTMASGWLSLGRVSKTGMTQSSSEEPLTHLAPPHASDQCGQGDLVPMGMRTSRLADMEVRLCQDLGLSPPACLCVLGGGGTKPLNLGWGREGLFACLFFFFSWLLLLVTVFIDLGSLNWQSMTGKGQLWVWCLPFFILSHDWRPYLVLRGEAISVCPASLVFLAKINLVFVK